MRQYREPTARNLLREPLVLGVPLPGLVALSFATVGSTLLFGEWRYGPATSMAMAGLGYVGLRLAARFSKHGWEETLIFAVEKTIAKYRKNLPQPKVRFEAVPFTVEPPETMTESDLLYSKSRILDYVTALRPGQSEVVVLDSQSSGMTGYRMLAEPTVNLTSAAVGAALRFVLPSPCHAYSLVNLPAQTDPLWLPSLLRRLSGEYKILVRLDGVDPYRTKHQVETARRRNAGTANLADVDGEVSYEEATRILEGLVGGDEALVRVSLVVLSDRELDLDPHYFLSEKDHWLSIAAVSGLRRRAHRSFLLRAATASDLIANLADPAENGLSVLRTRAGNPAYFSPVDQRLEALHWLVVGASGSGKSFFTGLTLKRLLDQGLRASVLFLDHNRSFRRLVRSTEYSYYEPSTPGLLSSYLDHLFLALEHPGAMVGLELSELSLSDKKAAAREVLLKVSEFLRKRQSTHVVYIVLDECWNFLRDEPALVQQAFREFRKLNGAAIAITQSLSDFLRDESGQSIVQNAPIRILLRQGEDMWPYRGALGLNDIEIQRLRELRQTKGSYSECLIKTPFMSRIARLHPTEEEHSLLRTDNLREEMVKSMREEST